MTFLEEMQRIQGHTPRERELSETGSVLGNVDIRQFADAIGADEQHPSA